MKFENLFDDLDTIGTKFRKIKKKIIFQVYENQIDKKPLYTPTHLEELSKEIKQKIVEKNLNIFQKIFKFLFGKKKI